MKCWGVIEASGNVRIVEADYMSGSIYSSLWFGMDGGGDPFIMYSPNGWKSCEELKPKEDAEDGKMGS